MIDKKNESNVQKDDSLEELHVNFKDFHPETHRPEAEKKNIVVIGNYMVKNADGRDVSCDDSVKIRPHPWASTEDLTEQTKPAKPSQP